MSETKSCVPQDDTLLGDSIDGILGESPVSNIPVLACRGSPKGRRDCPDDDDPHPPPVPRRDDNDLRPRGTAASLRRHIEEQMEVENDPKDEPITITATASSRTRRDHTVGQPLYMSAYFVHVPHQEGAGSSQAGISALTLDCPLEDEQPREVLDLEVAMPSKDLENVDVAITRSASSSQHGLPSSSSENETLKIDDECRYRFGLQSKEKAKVSRWFVAISILCLLLLVSLAVYGTIKSKNDEKTVQKSDEEGSLPFSNSVAPTDQQQGHAGDLPETPPSSSPSQSSMTPFPTESTIHGLDDLIRQAILDLLPNSFQALLDETSPQSKALDWLIDDLQDQPIVSRSKILQRWTMAIVYYGMNGDEWTFSEGWLLSDDICDWFSTSTDPSTICNDEGLLQRLELQNNNLLGEIPEEIQLLSESLLVLNLSQNQLLGVVPESLGKLTNVSLIQLQSNDLAGTIPSTMCDQQAEALVTLFVDCSEVTCSCCEGCL